jgi:hypothetical protein
MSHRCRDAPSLQAKFTLGLLIGVQEADKVFSKFTCQFVCKGWKKFALLPKKIASEVTKQQKKFTLMQNKI